MRRLLLPPLVVLSTAEGGESTSSQATGVAQKRDNQMCLMKKMCSCSSRKSLVNSTQLHENQHLLHSFSHLATVPLYCPFPSYQHPGALAHSSRFHYPGFSPFHCHSAQTSVSSANPASHIY